MANNNLTIGIPCYNCKKTLEKTLNSINSQTEQPYEIIFIDDASTQDYEEIFEKFRNLNIRYIKLEKNIRIGAVRAKIVNETKTKYLTMIDSDDMFYSVDVVSYFKEQIKTKKFDLFFTEFIQEGPDKKLRKYENSFVGCHGKIYNLDFMKKNNINFPPLTAHEEGYVNRSFSYYNGKVLQDEKITYFWHWNPKGITRTSDVMYKYFLDYAESVRLNLIDHPEKNLQEPLLSIYTYYDSMYKKYGNNKQIQEYKKFILENFKWSYKKMKDFISKERSSYNITLLKVGGKNYIPHKNILKFLKENEVE